jgi:1-deoxy-D-xylulose-5-phosphate reductoisomerase
MNKGLEVIEARWLFNAHPDQIEVLVHPQSIVHSMVAYRDGSVMAQLGTPDMRTPIAYSLAWPRRIEAGVERLNLAQMNDLSFEEPDLARFPCLEIAFQAMRAGASAPVTLNASNEIAVDAFLNGKIGFKQISALVSDVMERISVTAVKNLDDILGMDRQARQAAQQWVTKFYG